MIYIKILYMLLTLGFSFAHFERNLTSEKAPGCLNPLQCKTNLFYIKAGGKNDNIHYLWDFTNKPSMLMAHSKLDSTLKVNWRSFPQKEKGSITLSSSPDYCFFLVLDKLIEYDDVDDTGYFLTNSVNRTYDSGQMQWVTSQPLNNTPQESSVFEVKGSFPSDTNITGQVYMQVMTFGSESHDITLPRLLHSANSTQVKLVLQDLSSNSGFNHSRWAVQFIIVSTNSANGSLQVESKKNIDDENSPGVFNVVNIMPSKDVETELGGYLQWRPVVYTALTYSIGNSSDVGVLDPSNLSNPDLDLNRTLVTDFLTTDLHQLLIQSTVITFGSPQDGFYKKTNYSSWSFLIGYGLPQEETLSMLVILIMAIGLGLPAILIFLGGILMCVRRFALRKDELSLER